MYRHKHTINQQAAARLGVVRLVVSVNSLITDKREARNSNMVERCVVATLVVLRPGLYQLLRCQRWYLLSCSNLGQQHSAQLPDPGLRRAGRKTLVR
jgi:hypothetical protein